MSASDILDAVEHAYPQAAFIRELTTTEDIDLPCRRIDALMLHQQKWTALEVKISRADFKRDTEDKRRPWRSITDRFIYVTPAGLLSPEEIPAGCGLWEITEAGRCVLVKNARHNKERADMPDSLIRTVIYRLGMLERRVRRGSAGVGA